MDSDWDWTAAIFPLIIAFIVVLWIVLLVSLMDQTIEQRDAFNAKFQTQCKVAGGTSDIGNKDICFKHGKVLFQEH
jgi:hypothetical protein